MPDQQEIERLRAIIARNRERYVALHAAAKDLRDDNERLRTENNGLRLRLRLGAIGDAREQKAAEFMAEALRGVR